MPIEGLDAGEELVVVAHDNEHLCVILDTLSSKRSKPGKGADVQASEVAVRKNIRPHIGPIVR